MKTEIVLSLVIAICTALYTIINLMLWFESRATRKQKITPHILPFFKSTDTHTVEALYVKNIGEGAAKNVKGRVIKDYNRLGEENLALSQTGIFKYPIGHFPPNHEVKYFICDLKESDMDSQDSYIHFELSYERIDGKKYCNQYKIHFNELADQNYSNPPETFMGRIPYFIQEINKTLKDLVKTLKNNSSI